MASTPPEPAPQPGGAEEPEKKKKRGECAGAPLAAEDVAAGLETLCPSWKLAQEGAALEKEFVARNFAKAVEWINAAAAEAETLNHHPDIHLTSYRTLRVVVQTHSAKAITAVDFDLARKIDAIPTDYSPKFLRDNPHVRVVAPTGGKEDGV